jgi:hypothetical protein
LGECVNSSRLLTGLKAGSCRHALATTLTCLSATVLCAVRLCCVVRGRQLPAYALRGFPISKLKLGSCCRGQPLALSLALGLWRGDLGEQLGAQRHSTCRAGPPAKSRREKCAGAARRTSIGGTMRNSVLGLLVIAGAGIAGSPVSAAPLGTAPQPQASIVERTQDYGYCRRLRRACEFKHERGEVGEGNCSRYRRECGGYGSRWR